MKMALPKALHEELGARFGELAGVEVPRDYGDAGEEYRVARSAAVVVDRCDRAVVRVSGRDPVKMIHGLVTNDVAGAAPGQAVYAAMLTPKGKMVSDVTVLRRDPLLLLEVARAAEEGVRSHLRKFVPPLFARVEEERDVLGVLSVVGPAAGDVVAGALGVSPPAGAYAFIASPGPEGEVVVMRNDYAGAGYDIIAPWAALPALWGDLRRRGAQPAGHAALEVLRIEASTPRWGAELDGDVIPIEAGLRERAISETKGCYTGQEVIIRILHRGHVNRHLRGLLFGERPSPPQGTQLFRVEDGKLVGRVTSSCVSPALGQTIGLGYVRREIEPPSPVRVGDPAGPEAEVVALPFRPSPS